jgi:hypothetical protein
MKSKLRIDTSILMLVIGLLCVFILRTLLARITNPPRLDDIFIGVAVSGSVVMLIKGYRCLRPPDWIMAAVLGVVVGISMYFATLFSPYPFWWIIRGHAGQAVARGSYVFLAALGGLVIMRMGGPVLFRAARGEWRKSGVSIALGLAIGLPLAVLNVFALQMSQGKAIAWQNPLAAFGDALQPGIVEEVVYRFALLGLFWLVLRKSLPTQAPWLAGVLVLLVHNYSHFDELFLQAPLAALGMGLVMAVIWGLPLTILALRRDLDSAMAFHWLQDVTRFLSGF